MEAWRVIGWTNFENDYPNLDGSNIRTFKAARKAVIKEIREQGYRFAGDAHQYAENCCPVLNSGECLRLSYRSWGALMAEALGETGPMAYMNWYMNSLYPNGEERILVYPPAGVNDSQIVSKERLSSRRALAFKANKRERRGGE